MTRAQQARGSSPAWKRVVLAASLSASWAAVAVGAARPAGADDPPAGPKPMGNPARMSPQASELVPLADPPAELSFERRKLHASVLEANLDHALESVRALYRLAGLTVSPAAAARVRARYHQQVKRSFALIEHHLEALHRTGPDVARSGTLAAFRAGWERAKLDWTQLRAASDPLGVQARLENVHRNLEAARQNLSRFLGTLGLRRLTPEPDPPGHPPR